MRLICPWCMLEMWPVHSASEKRWVCITEKCDMQNRGLTPTPSPFPPELKLQFPSRG